MRYFAIGWVVQAVVESAAKEVKQIQWLLHFQFLPVFPESRQRILHENLELQTFGSQP